MARITLCAVIVLSLNLSPYSLADENRTDSRALTPFARKLLAADDSDLNRLPLGASQGLIELAPVHLPTALPGDCNHYG
jgi:hypothetical protein